MPGISNRVKRLKSIARERETKSSVVDNIQDQDGFTDSDDDKIVEEEVHDEDGDVFLDSDGVMEADSFMSQFSFTSETTKSSCEVGVTGRRPVYTFNSTHDGNTFMWVEDGKAPLRPKGDGNSIMVSEFLCPCHGVMKVSPEQARHNGWDFTSTGVVLYIGKNRDGYWDHARLVDQFRNIAIPMFNYLHPNKTAIFAFDNSQAHHKMAYDALNVNKLKLGDGLKAGVDTTMRDGWYINEEGKVIEQSLVLLNGQQKGIETIMKERGIWRRGMKLKDAKKLLKQQGDFIEQASIPWLREIAIAAGHIQTFFPKFHPELNFIERYWGMAKRYARARCGYTFEELKHIVPEALGSVSLITIRRMHNHCLRYVEAYAQSTLLPHQVEWAVRKYSSHRRCKYQESGNQLPTSSSQSPPFLTPEFMVDCPK